jgi:hypothetical protein
MTKRVEEMTLDELEELLGPGALVPTDDWVSRRWQCGRCEKVIEADEPIANPAPCHAGASYF